MAFGRKLFGSAGGEARETIASRHQSSVGECVTPHIPNKMTLSTKYGWEGFCKAVNSSAKRPAYIPLRSSEFEETPLTCPWPMGIALQHTVRFSLHSPHGGTRSGRLST